MKNVAGKNWENIVPFLLNAFAKSNQTTSLATTFHKHEGEKHRAYEECVWEV